MSVMAFLTHLVNHSSHYDLVGTGRPSTDELPHPGAHTGAFLLTLY